MPIAPLGPPGPALLAPAAPGRSFSEVLRARLPGPAAAPAAGPASGPAAAGLLGAVDRARARLDAVVAEARRGRLFSAGELLALQAEAYRAGQTLELASRAVEQGAHAVRQAMSTQV